MPKRPSSANSLSNSNTDTSATSSSAATYWFKSGEEYKQEKRPKNLKQLLDSLPGDHAYHATRAPISLRPRNKYCDITGLEGRHTDPKNNLRYHDASVYAFIQDLPQATVQLYLQIRNAAVILK